MEVSLSFIHLFKLIERKCNMEVILTDRGAEYLKGLDLKKKAVRIRAIDTYE